MIAMAAKDVKNYYYTMMSQYLEEKQNLADFEEALKNGHITEEQMSEAMEVVADGQKVAMFLKLQFLEGKALIGLGAARLLNSLKLRMSMKCFQAVRLRVIKSVVKRETAQTHS